jgi:uncharacterized protein (DUF924 family)
VPGPSVVLDFWFAPDTEEKWFQPTPDFDAEIAGRFGALHDEAAKNALETWEASPEGALALVILLDQFPRNMFRGSPRAFASDALALAVASRAIDRGHDLALPTGRRVFLYLPFEHSEDIEDQHRCCSLTAKHCDIGNYFDYAKRHRAVIARFGRFPHRNDVLGRESTAEEIAFLADRDEPF